MKRINVSGLNQLFNIDGPDYIIFTNDDHEPFKVKPSRSSNNSIKEIKKENTIISIKRDNQILYEKQYENPYEYDTEFLKSLLGNIRQPKQQLKLSLEEENILREQERIKNKVFIEYHKRKETEIKTIQKSIKEEDTITYSGLSYLKSKKYLNNLRKNLLYEKIDNMINDGIIGI